ncbi:hypothetical protein HZH68_011435 [Vespula germanica]|uniref:Uncharacterized protein n=1 Tax=Vespula germanica TaxID=30212 RepID=A0A834N0G4_VESGE|nr:hypothetical protein HZH68_011435 [Vespula germanica]
MWVDAVGISCSFQAKSGLARYEGLLQWMAIGGKSAVRGYKYARDMLDDRTDSGSAIVSDEERLVGGASRSMTQVVGDMSMFAIVLDLASLRRLLIAVFILSSLPCYRCLDLAVSITIRPVGRFWRSVKALNPQNMPGDSYKRASLVNSVGQRLHRDAFGNMSFRHETITLSDRHILKVVDPEYVANFRIHLLSTTWILHNSS